MPKFRVKGFGLGLEHGYFLFNGEEMGIGAVIPLDVCMDTPVVGCEDLLDNEGISVRAPLNVSKEPGREGVRNMVSRIDAGGSVKVLDEDASLGPPVVPMMRPWSMYLT